MTWKEFKDAVENQGMKDEMVVDFIDWEGEDDPVIDIENLHWVTIT